MANTALFKSSKGPLVPRTDTFNRAGGKAYSLSPKHALAQYAATGCLNATFYASAEEDLDKVIGLCSAVEPLFLAKTAVYAREKGFMKDMPALLCAALSVLDGALCTQVFGRVIDDGKIVALDTPDALKREIGARIGKNGATTMEDVFLSLTGKSLDDDFEIAD